MRRVLVIVAGMLGCMTLSGCWLFDDCTSSSPGTDEIHFALDGGQYDADFRAAWDAARATPDAGLQYGFPLASKNLDDHSVVKLYAGRPTGILTGTDVVLDGEVLLATIELGSDGTGVFDPLHVVSRPPAPGAGELPVELLCGSTTIAARAYAPPAGPLTTGTGTFEVATWFTVDSPACAK